MTAGRGSLPGFDDMSDGGTGLVLSEELVQMSISVLLGQHRETELFSRVVRPSDGFVRCCYLAELISERELSDNRDE